jgi:hypothetical protein
MVSMEQQEPLENLDLLVQPDLKVFKEISATPVLLVQLV